MAIYSNSANSFLNSLLANQRREETKAASITTARDKYLTDSKKVSTAIANMAGPMLPPGAKKKTSDYGGAAPHQQVDDAFADDNPLKGIGTQTMAAVQKLSERNLGDITGQELTQRVFQRALERRIVDAYRYNLKQETAIFKKPVGQLPGYDRFKEIWQETEGADRDHVFSPFGVGTHAIGLGSAAGLNTLMEGAGRVLPKVGIKALPLIGKTSRLVGRGLFALPGATPQTMALKLAGLALMETLGTVGGVALANKVEDTNWFKARPDEQWKTGIATVAAGLAGGGVGIGVGGKINSAVKRTQQQMAMREAYHGIATDALQKSGTVDSLLEYNRSLKAMRRSKKVAQSTMDDFMLKNKDKVAKLTPTDNLPMVIPKKEFVADDVIDIPTGLQTDDVIYPPPVPQRQLEAPLPTQVEKSFGSRMNHEQRRSMNSFYDYHISASQAVNTLDTIDASVANVTALNKHFARFPNTKKIPMTLFGTDKTSRKLAIKINEKLAKTYAVSGLNGLKAALDNGFAGKPWKATLQTMGEVGRKKVIEAVENGMPLSTAVFRGADWEAWVKNNSTSALRGTRDSDILKGVRSDEVKGSFNSGKIHTSATKASGEGLSTKDVDSLAEVAEPSIPINISGQTFEEGVDVPIDTVVKALGRDPEFMRRPAVSESIKQELKTMAGNLGVVKGEDVNKLIQSGLVNRTFAGNKIVRKAGATNTIKSEIDEAIEQDTTVLEWLKDSPNPRMMQMALLTVPVSAVALLGEGTVSDAEAGIGAFTSMFAANLVKQSGKGSAKEIVKTLNDSAYTLIKGNKPGQVQQFMDGYSVAPTIDAVKNSNPVLYNKATDRLLTPGAVADQFYDSMSNPSTELATRTTAIHNNIKAHGQAVNEILSDVPGFKDASKAVRDKMKPLVDKYQSPITEASVHRGMRDEFKKKLKYVNKKKDPELHDTLTRQIDESEQSLKVAMGQLKELNSDWEKSARELAAEHSSSRIALALEDTPEYEFYPWLKEMMSDSEKVAVSRLKDLNKQTEGRIVEAGGNVIKSRPFAHHALHPDVDEKRLMKELSMKGINATDTLAMSRLNSRAVGSKMMMPDVQYMYNRYVPDVERRIQGMKFWKKGKEGGWDAHQKELKKAGLWTPKLEEYWKQVNESWQMKPQTAAGEWARRYYSFEVLWRLFLSPSVGFKHLMKQTGNLAVFPADVWARGIMKTPKVLYQHSMMELKERFPTALKNFNIKPSEETKLVRAYINQGKYNNAIAELEYMDAPKHWIDKQLQHINEFGSLIVGTVENFDRAATVLMGMEMAAKKGMTPSQATYAVYDTILKANFLSGMHNPVWIRDPHMRAFLMFQGTPFKLMEQRALRAIKAGKSAVKATGFSIEELKGLKSYIKTGEKKFKENLVMEGLKSEKDVYGQSVTWQFMKNMLTLGGIIGLGDQYLDVDLSHHAIHPPFVKFGQGGGVGLALNPLASAGMKTWASRHEEDPDLLLTEFVNNWMGSSGPAPAVFNKAFRTAGGDIPEIYKDSKWKYILSVPGSGSH